MIVIDRKFFSQYYNDNTFTSDLTNFATNLSGSVMEKKKSVYTVNVDVSTILLATSGLSFIVNSTNGTIVRQSGSFLSDGWSVGDEFQASATGGVAPNFTGKILSVTSTDIYYTLLTGTDATGQVFNWDMTLTSVLEGFQMFYGIIENSEPTNYVSKLDGTSQGFYAHGVGFDTGGGVRSTALVTAQPLGNNINKSWVNGGVKVKYVQNIGHIQQFEVEHEFLIPWYFDGELTNLQNLVLPTDFAGSNSYKYVSKYEFRRVLTDPNSTKIVIDDVTLGSVGYYNEPFNGLNNTFSVLSLGYEDTLANPMTRIEAGKETVVKFTINSNVASFSALSKVGFKCSYLPTLSESQNPLNNLEDNYIYDSIIATATGSTVTLLSPIVIKSYKFTYVDANNIYVEANVLFTDSRIDNTKSYVLGCEIASLLGSNTLGDKTVLRVAVDTFEKSTDVAGLFDVDRMEFELYPDAVGHYKSTNIEGWVEDAINLDYDFWLDQSKNAFLDSLNIKIVAFNAIDNTFFELESIPIDLTNGIVVSGTQIFNVNQSMGFNFTNINDYNIIKLSNGTLVGSKQYYNGNISLKIDWQEWLSLPNANTIFYDNAEVHNGLNENASNYSLVSNYEIRFFIDADVTESTSGISTNYIVSNPQNKIYNYDLDNNGIPNFTGTIRTYNTLGANTGGTILTNQDTKVIVEWDNLVAISSVTGYLATISLEPINSPSKNSIIINNTTLSLSSGNILSEHTVDFTTLSAGVVYKISARIKCLPNDVIARMTTQIFVGGAGGNFTFKPELREGDDITPLVIGDKIVIEVKNGATTIEEFEGVYGSDISTFTPVLGSPSPTSSITNWANGIMQNNGTITLSKKQWADANLFNYINGSLSGSSWTSLAKELTFIISATDISNGDISNNFDNNMIFERVVDLIEGSFFSQIEPSGSTGMYSMYDNDGFAENYNEQTTFELFENGISIDTVLPTFTPSNFSWGTRDLHSRTISGITGNRYEANVGFNNGMLAKSETVISGSNFRLEFAYNRRLFLSNITETFIQKRESDVSSTIVQRAFLTGNYYNGIAPLNVVDVLKNAVLYITSPYIYTSGQSGESDWLNIDMDVIGQRNTIRYESIEGGIEFFVEYELELNYVY